MNTGPIIAQIEGCRYVRLGRDPFGRWPVMDTQESRIIWKAPTQEYADEMARAMNEVHLATEAEHASNQPRRDRQAEFRAAMAEGAKVAANRRAIRRERLMDFTCWAIIVLAGGVLLGEILRRVL